MVGWLGFVVSSLQPLVLALQVLAKVIVSCSLLSTLGNYFSLLWRRYAQPSPQPGEGLACRLSRCCCTVTAEMPSVLSADLRVWPAYDVITFAVIPPLVRPFATAFVSTAWHTYMAYRAAVPQGDTEHCKIG